MTCENVVRAWNEKKEVITYETPQLVRADRLNQGKNFGNVRAFYESNAINANAK